MNPVTRGMEGSTVAPMLYMALDLSNKTWKLFGDEVKCRQVGGPAGYLIKLAEAVTKAKERFGLSGEVRVVSCYEAGRDGFWLDRHLRSVGIENAVVDAASIAVDRRTRRAKTDRLDGERLLAKLIRHHAGERSGWSVVRVPSVTQEDARRLHRELERLKREHLAHRCRIQFLLVTQGIRVKVKRAFRARLQTLILLDASSLPEALWGDLERECDRLERVERQIEQLRCAWGDRAVERVALGDGVLRLAGVS